MARDHAQEIRQLLDLVEESHPNSDPRLIEEAYYFAQRAHEGQLRKDNITDYMTHPYEVARLVAEYRLDAVSVAAALLHDTIEDAGHKRGISLKNIKKQFGGEVARLVNGLTKLQSAPNEKPPESKGRTLKFILAETGQNDVRTLIIKIFDRYHNIQTLQVFRKEKQLRIARETVKFYIPLADRLGLFEINRKMEDFAFRYLYPERYAELKAITERRKEEFESEFRPVTEQLTEELVHRNIEFCQVRIFPRHPYEISRMLDKNHCKPEQIDEIAAYNMEIIVANDQSCFLTMYVIHHLFRHLPLMIKDFINNPKINDYRSLHTVIRVLSGKKIQCLIRTQEMAQHGHYGIILKVNKGEVKTLGWLNDELVKNIDEVQSEDITDLTTRLFFPEIDVFTPRGEPIKLPEGATALDFAYYIHTDIGNQAMAAVINGRPTSLGTILKSGDKVHINTDVDITPRAHWIGIVRTERARLAIRRGFRRIDEKTPQWGWRCLAAYLHRFEIALNPQHKRWERIAKELSYPDEQAMFRDIFYGRLFYQYLLRLLLPYLEFQEQKNLLAYLVSKHLIAPAEHENFTFMVNDRKELTKFLDAQIEYLLIERFPAHSLIELKDVRFPMPITLKHCCKPEYGDEIVALTVRERGAAIHRTSCGNVRYNILLGSRNLVEARWIREPSIRAIEFHLESHNRKGLLKEIFLILDVNKAVIVEESMKTDGNSQLKGLVKIQLSELEDVSLLLHRIRGIDGVTKIELR